MSAILLNEKRFYQKALSIETLILLFFSGLTWLFSDRHTGLSFVSGCFSAVLPQLLFVYWIFFRSTAKNANKMQAFYRGEGLKWLATIILIALLFGYYTNLQHLIFFAGYFLGLLSNIFVPMFLKQWEK